MASSDVPVYRIDLSLAPEQRYVQVAKDFAQQLKAIAPLYEGVLAQLLVYRPVIGFAKLLIRLCLRRVYDEDETREIRSIAETAGVDLHLIVVLNTLLDCMLGCTSGTVPVRNDEGAESPAHLMHFRTLDWGMPQLGSLLVHLEFVNSQSANPGEVLARSITYAGFVGCLTGVRPLLNAKSTSSVFHQLCVLFGQRPAIASGLRQVLLSPTLPSSLGSSSGNSSKTSLVDFAKTFAARPSPPCYLIFSTPREAVVVQKDFVGGNIKSTRDVIVQANHDTDHTLCCGAKEFHHRSLALGDYSMIPPEDAWLTQSAERQDFVLENWRMVGQRQEQAPLTNGLAPRRPLEANGSCIALGLALGESQHKPTSVTRERLQRWVTSDPVFNEFTHFATVMDPLSGDVICLERRTYT
ncbi:Acid ceramidase 1 [Colletotrichum chlorophyti]|uniref:ceramidase n=1 Tax=Colletotrichum chlorophyti TaxID=708187 RepID=A0A1Q8RV83_9PEZI|nr:Acid ceramidase 1 [Colletotrichum chlorophyti]